MIGMNAAATLLRRLGPRSRHDRALTERQRALVDTKLEMLRQASSGFTEDRLLHLQGEELESWSDGCTSALRAGITAVGPPHVEIILLDFPALRCLSLQCRAEVPAAVAA